MGLKADLESSVDSILSISWSVRDGVVVPRTEDIKLANGAVRLDATYLYADLQDSTKLATEFDRQTAARVVRAYLAAMSRLIRAEGGEIRSFDGDRVMGIFVGDSMCSSAAKCALRMNWAFRDILVPKITAEYPGLQGKGYKLGHTAGIDTSKVLVVRAGVRDNNDLVSIGRAPNYAAKLSQIRSAPYRSYITKAVFDRLRESSRLRDGGEPMWQPTTIRIGGKDETVYRSRFYWSAK